jgi:Flp pilus assembly pilin Flp
MQPTVIRSPKNNIRGESNMNSIKRFFADDSGTAEATSTVIMITGVGLLLAAGLIAWYGTLHGFFNTAGSNMDGAAANFALPTGS